MPHQLSRAAAFLLITAGFGANAQSAPPVRELLKTERGAWVTGVAEPGSARFIAYSTEQEQGIKIYNRQTKKTSTIRANIVGALGGSLSISKSGSRLIFAADDDAKRTTHIWSVDLDSLTGVPVSEPHRVSIVPAVMASISDDGRWIALSANDQNTRNRGAGSRLLVMPSDGGDERMLDSAGRILTPRWSPDGKTIFYVRGRGHGPALARIRLSGGAPDSLAPAQAIVGVSPDGKHVAVIGNDHGTQAIARITNLDGKTTSQFEYNGDDLRLFGWSNNPTPTLLAVRQLSPATLKTISLADGRVVPYAVTEPYPTNVLFSPDGSRLAVSADVGGRTQLVIYNLKDKARRVLPMALQAERSSLQWSPDGSRIAFTASDSLTANRVLFAIDVASGQPTRLADMRSSLAATHTLYRWRSDSRSIDFITTAPPHTTAAAQLRRVTLDGHESLIRELPAVEQQQGTGSGFRLVDDKTVLAAGNGKVQSVPVPSGDAKTLYTGAAWWAVWNSPNILSPDGKWIVTGAAASPKKLGWVVMSTDGKPSRLLGTEMGCDSWPVQWLPDSRSFLAVGAASCENWREDFFIVSIGDGTVRRIQVPENQAVTLTPDGRALLVAVDDPKETSLVALDVAQRLVGGRP